MLWTILKYVYKYILIKQKLNIFNLIDFNLMINKNMLSLFPYIDVVLKIQYMTEFEFIVNKIKY